MSAMNPKILTIIGARPQFIKAFPLSAAISRRTRLREIVVHTGQHYDHIMSDVFFEELGISKPDYNLGVGSAGHGAQTGRMMEKLEQVMLHEKPLMVIKKDSSRQNYDRKKLLTGIRKACEKRPVSVESIEQIADGVEKHLYIEYGREVPTETIGEIIMDKLHELDQVAYVRFASVYRQFESVSDFVKEIRSLS